MPSQKDKDSKRKTTPARAPAKKTATSRSKSAASGRSAAKSSSAKRATPRVPKGQERVKTFDGKMVNQPTALAFLMQQHREVEAWFAAYERASSDEQKAQLSGQICNALKVHTQIEEELLYPEAHEKLQDEDLVDEATIEHQSAKELIAQIESMSVGEHLYDAKVKVLGEYVKHHVREEETEMFPEIRKSDMDLAAIGERLKARADELMAQMERGEEAGRRPGRRGLLGGLLGGDQRT